MTESKQSIPSSRGSRQPMHHLDLHKLQSQQDTLQSRLLDLKESLNEKDMVLKSQRNTIKLYEHKMLALQQNNTTLRAIVSLLSRHITEELNETLPPMPGVPEEEEQLRLDPVSLLNPKSPGRRKKAGKGNRSFHASTSPVQPLSSFSTVFRQKKGYVRAAETKPVAFDPVLAQNLFKDFSGAEFLSTILDAQIARDQYQKTVKFLLGNVSKEVLLFQTRAILFETLSLFLTSRNVAYQNASDVFLPRMLEMLLDVLEVDRVVLYVYDPQTESFYSRAVTADLPEQLVFHKDFGHLSTLYATKAAIVISNAYDDRKFDPSYDQLSGTITQNLACVPLSLGEELLGALECVNKHKPFGPTDIVVMSQAAKQLAIGLAGAEVKDKLQSLTKRSAASRGSIDSSKEALVFPLIQAIVAGVQTQVSCERVTIFMYDSKENELVSLYGVGLQGVIRMQVTRGIASLAFTTKTALSVPKAEEHSMFNGEIDKKTGFVTREVLAVPIGNRGVLECINKKNLTPFSKSDENRASAMATVIGKLLEAGDNLEGVLMNADFNELCVQAVKVAILHVNSQGLLQKANQCAVEVFQLTPERMTGMTLTELLSDSPDIMSDFQSAVSKVSVHSVKSRRLVISRDHRHRSETVVNVTILPLLGLVDGPAFVVMLTKQQA